ncbi:MAG: hypothetical protein RJA98_1024 [Pseudomonadota bacterium]|jgi:hypothetical protein
MHNCPNNRPDPCRSARLNTQLRLGGAALLLLCLPTAARADFSATGGTGIAMTMLLPVVLAGYLITAPPGRRALVFTLALLGLPLWALAAYGLAGGVSDGEQADAWWRWTSWGAGLAWLPVLALRVRHVAREPLTLSWDPVHWVVGVTALGVLLPTLVGAELGHPLLRLGATTVHALQMAMGMAGIGLWWRRPWAWRLLCAALLFVAVAPAVWQPSLIGHGRWWFWQTPVTLALGLLVLPFTRRQCMPKRA